MADLQGENIHETPPKHLPLFPSLFSSHHCLEGQMESVGAILVGDGAGGSGERTGGIRASAEATVLCGQGDVCLCAVNWKPQPTMAQAAEKKHGRVQTGRKHNEGGMCAPFSTTHCGVG